MDFDELLNLAKGTMREDADMSVFDSLASAHSEFVENSHLAAKAKDDEIANLTQQLNDQKIKNYHLLTQNTPLPENSIEKPPPSSEPNEAPSIDSLFAHKNR